MKKLFFILLFFISSCASVKTWSYKPNKMSAFEPDSDIVIMHPFLKDARPRGAVPENSEMPRTRQMSEGAITEETFVGRNLRPTVDFAKAVSTELMNTSYFQDVSYTDDQDFYILLHEKILILEGTLNRADVSSVEYYSKLSVLGWPFWALGVPYGKTTSVVNITYRLRNSTSQILFERTYTGVNEEMNGLYYNPVTASFEKAVKQIALTLANDLRYYFVMGGRR